jgi:hypothetical protein
MKKSVFKSLVYCLLFLVDFAGSEQFPFRLGDALFVGVDIRSRLNRIKI